MKYELVYDEVILKQLKKAAKDNKVKEILSKMFDKLENKGPEIGELLDSKVFIYELKNMHPPIRLYYKPDLETDKIKVFEFEMKTGQDKQQKTIDKIKNKVFRILGLF